MRSLAALGMTLLLLASTGLAVACSASPASVSPTAVSAAATSISAAGTTVSAAGTSVAQVQGTAEPIATRVAGALTQLAPPDVGRLIGTTMGASIDVTLAPPGTSNDQATQVTLSGTDRSGNFGRLDQQARRAFAGAGLQLARQAYPRAQLDLTIDDTNGNRLLTAHYPPGGSPAYQ